MIFLRFAHRPPRVLLRFSIHLDVLTVVAARARSAQALYSTVQAWNRFSGHWFPKIFSMEQTLQPAKYNPGEAGFLS